MDLLADDLMYYEDIMVYLDRRLRKLLRTPGLNLDSGDELANALDKCGLVEHWPLTPTGRRSTARDAIQAAVSSPKVSGLLQYRGALGHCLANFARPWLALAQASPSGERLHPEWNQVRQRGKQENDLKGTKTGRLSCSNPNFQNPPNEYDLSIPPGLPDLPIMRKYLLPERGHVWAKRDYSQQELRILAHFSEGRLYERYMDDPRIDAHTETGALIKEYAHKDLPRKYVKITGFSVIYGSGIPGLSRQLGVHPNDAQDVRDAYFAALPEVPTLMRECQDRGKRGLSVVTWGGRHYFVEPPKVIKGQRRSFEYKLLNYLIQGSAADCTKEAILRWDEDPGNGEFLCTVHDEINISIPKEGWHVGMGKLRKAMESIEFDIPMLSDGSYGPNWATLKECK
jgi:DNA polymerase-1